MTGLVTSITRGVNKLKPNAPTILTGLGALGVIGTAVLTAKATPKAIDRIETATFEKGENLTKTEVIINASPAYIPAAVVGAATIGCIFGANILNKRQQAALSSAYALLDSSFRQYRQKVNDIYGEDADAKVMSAVLSSEYDGHIPSKDKRLYYEEWSNRYYEISEEQAQNAEYLLNRSLALQGYASLNELYFFLGLPPTEKGAVLGWSESFLHEMHGCSWIDFEYMLTMMDDGLECYIIGMDYRPSPDYTCY